MVEKTCHLILKIVPHNLMTLGLLTQALIGQERFEDALNVGSTVIELSAIVGEMPNGMGAIHIKKMADYLLGKKDYVRAVRLWQAGVKCQPGDVNALLELSQALLSKGDKAGAHQQLRQAQSLAPQNQAVLALLRTVALEQRTAKPVGVLARQSKKRH